MNRYDAQPTLLVFTLGAGAESRRRPLLPEALRGEERAFRRACLDAALEAGAEAGCRLELSSPSRLPGVARSAVTWRPQTGEGFGARLAGALDDCFERRAEATGPVVLVGTDVPGLGADHVTRALAALEDDPDRVVLGPSPDGGFYLLATGRPIDGLAEAVRWCSAATLVTLRATLESAGRPVTLLAPLADLDAPGDLERWIKTARRQPGAPSRLRAWAAHLGRVLDGLKKLLPRLVPSLAPTAEPVVVPVRGPPRRPLRRPVRRPTRRR